MIRKIAATAFILLLGACQTTQAPANKDYSATVADAAKTVCIPYVGDTAALRKAAMDYTGDSGKEFDSENVAGKLTVWHYQIVQDERNVAFVAVTSPGGCSVAFVNTAASLNAVRDELNVEVFGEFDLDELKNQTVYGRIGASLFVVSFGAFNFDGEKAAKGVDFLTREIYETTEVPRGAPKLKWGG